MSLILIIQNVSGPAVPVSDYRYQVVVGDGTPEKSVTLASGDIKGHARADGWQALVRRLLAQEAEMTETTEL